MVRVPLTNGGHALVSDEDACLVGAYRWSVAGRGYATGNNKSATLVKMHRLVTGAKPGQVVDHINRDKLDNRRENLRLVTQSENMHNAPVFATNKSGHKGVAWFKRDACWRSYITVNYRQIHLGYYQTIEQAARAREQYTADKGIVS